MQAQAAEIPATPDHSAKLFGFIQPVCVQHVVPPVPGEPAMSSSLLPAGDFCGLDTL
jgi:hypothetical protein